MSVCEGLSQVGPNSTPQHNPQVKKKSASDRSSRQSPEGREREFPSTRIGVIQAVGHRQPKGDPNMGGGDDRYYHSTGHSTSQSSGNVRCVAGQLGQSRDFHYTVQDHHAASGGSSGYRTASSSSSTRTASSRQDPPSGYHHSPHVSTSTRSRSSRDSYYLDQKPSPYHHGSSGSNSSRSASIRANESSSSSDRQEPSYALLRQRQQPPPSVSDYDHRIHHSSSRSDLIGNEIYDHGLTTGSPYGVPPQTQYTFVRMCDGKFVRTAIPLHDFDSLEGSGYYRMAATLRRPTKRHTSAASQSMVSTTGAAGDVYNCCPRVDDLARSSRGPPVNYATLRGQKWSQRQKAGCGVGDNYGRRSGLSFHDDSQSINDDLLVQHLRNTADFQQFKPQSGVGLALPSSKLGTMKMTSSMMSRSTDRNLDNLGLDDDDEDEDDIEDDEEDDEEIFADRRSDPEALSLLTREPPDGKEKPEPIKSSMHKLERKSSKCDLLPSSVGSSSGSGSGNGAIETSNCRSEATSLCGDNSSVLSSSTVIGVDRSKGDGKRDSLSSNMNIKDGSNLFVDGILPPPPPLNLPMSQEDVDGNSNSDFRKQVPSSPRCAGVSLSGLAPIMSSSVISNSAASTSLATSPKNVSSISTGLAISQQPQINISRVSSGSGLTRVGSGRESGGEVISMTSRPIIQYSGAATPTSGAGAMLAPQSQAHHSISSHANAQLALSNPSGHTHTTHGGHNQALASQSWKEGVKSLVFGSTAKFFGVHQATEESSRLIWNERRRRLAVKRFGGIKDDYHLEGGTFGNHQYGDVSGAGLGVSNLGTGGSGGCNRLRYDQHLTSELEGDKMVLKISKPPRNKDSFSSLTGQTISWLLKSMITRKVPIHQCVTEHDVSRSYQPSSTGVAAYYQAEAGGLAVCPPFPRVPSSHHLHGESPAEEVFFTKPTCDGDESGAQGRLRMVPYTADPYRSCSWQLPRPETDLPRMSSDVGASRIWNRLLDAAFDNSDRRKHGMGIIGRLTTTRRKATRRSPESNRKRKLGGNSGDHRPYFTYWMTCVQIFVLLISICTYGIGPIGVDLFKKQGMVLMTNLELEQVAHLEPANFWIGPAVSDLIHLGAKYAPCMRWDEDLDREIREERLKERDTACCIRKDRAGCVQSPKTECSKYGDPTGSTPRSNWWRPSEWYSKYPNENRRSSGPVCGLDPAYCEAPASVAPYIWPDDITKWPICRRKTDMESIEGQTAEHMICEVIGHPCCIGIRGQCKITTKEYCMFVGGTFHEEAALCSQVSCLDDVCGLLPFRTRDVPDQFYRVWTPVFLHAGILHLVLTVGLQYWLMRDLEKMAGAARIALIYLGSGMVGNLASAIFVPYRAEVGPAGAHFGLLACCMVEVIHQWHMLKYPEMAILKLVGITALFFLAGLLPWVDNYAHLFGFIFGFLLSYALLPFVTFGRVYDRRRKVFLIIVCLVSVICLLIGLLLLFYITPIHDCEVCKYFNCIPITKDFCADQNIDLRADV